MTVAKRTFEALQYPAGSAERIRLNLDWRTSEYMPSYRYGVIDANGQRTPWTFRTKAEAVAQCAKDAK